MNKRTLLFLITSGLAFLCLFSFALIIGKYSISVHDFVFAVFTKDENYSTARSVILNLRLPRTLIAGLSGVALSLSGLLYQETFQNKLTSPDLLGVSSGASVGAATAIILGFPSVWVSVSAFAFGIITVILTLLLSRVFKNTQSVSLILAGVIVGGFMSALLSLVKYFADPTTTLTSITYWLMGSFENSTMNQAYIMLGIVITSSIVLLMISWRINIIALGQEEAQTKGLNYKAYRYVIIGIATLLTAVTVAFCGTISWIGLVIPHIVRLITGKDTRRSIPLCITFGGLFMIAVDIISRTFTKSEIPLSAITGLFGTVIFVVIILAKRKTQYGY